MNSATSGARKNSMTAGVIRPENVLIGCRVLSDALVDPVPAMMLPFDHPHWLKPFWQRLSGF
ncbi:hypothetical protein [Methanoculleus sp.]|uniref:hypothetical protein n=1 Tax=Methanoculleus sp. TaxID=90427 RepID=UPI0025E87308|nr:hypothetical protein [Methanoculleus sp.]MCK9317037.1 hypothetical protein [Methanoculleus sp.]